MEIRVDAELERAFAEAAGRESATAAEALERLMRDFVRRDRLAEAHRQSRRVAEAPDAAESMDVLMDAQRLADD